MTLSNNDSLYQKLKTLADAHQTDIATAILISIDINPEYIYNLYSCNPSSRCYYSIQLSIYLYQRLYTLFSTEQYTLEQLVNKMSLELTGYIPDDSSVTQGLSNTLKNIKKIVLPTQYVEL